MNRLLASQVFFRSHIAQAGWQKALTEVSRTFIPLSFPPTRHARKDKNTDPRSERITSTCPQGATALAVGNAHHLVRLFDIVTSLADTTLTARPICAERRRQLVLRHGRAVKARSVAVNYPVGGILRVPEQFQKAPR
jgi:hypothetical protein